MMRLDNTATIIKTWKFKSVHHTSLHSASYREHCIETTLNTRNTERPANQTAYNQSEKNTTFTEARQKKGINMWDRLCDSWNNNAEKIKPQNPLFVHSEDSANICIFTNYSLF